MIATTHRGALAAPLPPLRHRRTPAAIRTLRIGREARGLVRIASPIAAIGLMNMLLSLTDTVMIGRLDPNGLAAVVVVSDLYSILFNFTVGFSAVVAPAVSATMGAGVDWRVCTIVQRVMLLVCALAVAGGTVVWFIPDIMQALGLRLVAAATTRAYAHYMAGAFLLLVLFAMARHVLSATGRSRVAVIAIALAVPANAALNRLFMAGGFGIDGIGVAGAGLASLVVALGLCGATTAYLFLAPSFDNFRDLPRTERIIVPAELLRLARQAVQMGLGAIAETGGFLASTLIVGLVAPNLLVAHTLAFRALGICYLLIAGVGQAATIRLAFLSGRPARRGEPHARTALMWCGAALMTLLVLVFCGFPTGIARLMALAVGVDSPALIGAAAGLIPLAGVALAAVVPAHLVCAMLKANGRTKTALAVQVAGQWGIGLTAMLFVWWLGLGATGVWIALICGAVAASVFAILWSRMPGTPGLALPRFGNPVVRPADARA
jgi:MATE family multidrug resistance protein